jgi:hypothetical protein
MYEIRPTYVQFPFWPLLIKLAYFFGIWGGELTNGK